MRHPLRVATATASVVWHAIVVTAALNLAAALAVLGWAIYVARS